MCTSLRPRKASSTTLSKLMLDLFSHAVFFSLLAWLAMDRFDHGHDEEGRSARRGRIQKDPTRSSNMAYYYIVGRKGQAGGTHKHRLNNILQYEDETVTKEREKQQRWRSYLFMVDRRVPGGACCALWCVRTVIDVSGVSQRKRKRNEREAERVDIISCGRTLGNE